jgi:intracellular sulfur oxidation DsrE/DsrF family protein
VKVLGTGNNLLMISRSISINHVQEEMMSFIIPQSVACFLTAIFMLASSSAMAADDKVALTGLKEVKVGFDLKEGDGKLLLHRLDIIDETREELIQQGVTPHFILAFRGPATKLVQTDVTLIKPEDREVAAKIAAKIKQMRAAPGLEGFEQCSVAAREQGTKVEKVLPEIRVVGNGFISLMAYQAKGYAYIAP